MPYEKYPLTSLKTYTFVKSDWPVISSLNTRMEYVGTYVSKTSVQLPKFPDIIRQHNSATTPRTVESYKIQSRSPLRCSVSFRNVNGGTQTETSEGDAFLRDWLAPPSFKTPTSQPVSGATNAFLASVHSTLASAESATWAAEFVESLTIVSSPFKAIKAALLSVQKQVKGKLTYHKTKKRRLAELSSAYLSFMFGAKPAIESTFGLLSDLQQMDARGLYTRVRVTVSDLATTNSSESWNHVNSNTEQRWRVRFTKKLHFAKSTRTHGGLFFPQQSSDELAGVDPMSWVRAGWEIIPLSFIVDYITPVSQFLQAISARKTRMAWTSQTTREVVDCYVTTLGCYWQGVGTVFRQSTQQNASFTAQRKRLVRTSGLAAMSLPGIRFASSAPALVNSIATLCTKLNRDVFLQLNK